MRNMCIILTLCLNVLFANAQPVWPGAGSGTSGVPYIITTAGQLDSIRYFLDASFKLGNDIDLDDYIKNKPEYTTAGWLPIGTITDMFKGQINGNGYVITNLRIDRSGEQCVGFFGVVQSAYIQDLCIYLAKDGVIGDSLVGGLVGLVDYGFTGQSTSIFQCRVTGNIEAQKGNAGGIAGRIANLSTVAQCRYVGDIEGDENIGGLVGEVDLAYVSNSYALANVKAMRNAGGLVGHLTNRSKIDSSYVLAKVISSTDNNTNTGGIVGYADTINMGSQINQCVAIVDSIHGDGNIGFITGAIDTTSNAVNEQKGEAHYNYTYRETKGATSGSLHLNGTPVGLDTLQMIDFYKDSVSWDVNDIWMIDSLISPYPILKGFNHQEQAFLELLGDGSDTDPFRIYSAAQLDSMRNYLDKSFILMNNIDLSSYTAVQYGNAGWLPIGDATNPFTGKLFGNKHVIYNLRINRYIEDVGLFGCTDGAHIDSLGVRVAAADSVKGGDNNTGILIGTMKGVTTVHGVYVQGSAFGNNNVGGIAGAMNVGSRITYSYATGSVKGASSNIGGIAGRVDKAVIRSSYALNNVIGANTVGGVAGWARENAYVDSSVAINPSIKAAAVADEVGKIIGNNVGIESAIDNYAYDAMTGIWSTSTTSLNGTDTSLSALQGLPLYQEKLGWYINDGSVPDSGWVVQSNFPHFAWEMQPETIAEGLICNPTYSIDNASGTKSQFQWLCYYEGVATPKLIGTSASVVPPWDSTGNTLISVSYYDSDKNAYAHSEIIYDVKPLAELKVENTNTCQRSDAYDYEVVFSGQTFYHRIPAGKVGLMTFRDTVNCTKVQITNLQINPVYSETKSETVKTGDACPWIEITYDATFNSNTVGIKDTTLSLRTGAGCDSVIVYQLTVEKAPVIIKAKPATKAYGDPNPAFECTITYPSSPATMPINEADVTYTCDATLSSPVGKYVITPIAPEYVVNNYNVTRVSDTLTITKHAAMVEAADITKGYGEANPQFRSVLTGVLPADTATIQAAITYTCTATQYSNIGTYTITPVITAITNANYTFASPANGTLTIQKRAITVTAKDTSKMSGAVDPELKYTVSAGSLVDKGNGKDAFTGALTRDPGETTGASYTIRKGTLTLDDDNNGNNYNMTFVEGTLHIYVKQELTWEQTFPDFCNLSNWTVTLNATSNTTGANPAGAPIVYLSSNESVARINGNVMTVVGPGTTVITATQAGNDYYQEAEPKTQTIVVNLPAEQYVRMKWDDMLVFNNENQNYRTYQWYKNSSIISGATYQTYYDRSKINGSYYVELNGGEQRTCPFVRNASSPAPVANAEMLKIYPNPASVGQLVNVEINLTREELQGAFINIVDMNGAVVKNIKNIEPAMQLNMPAKQGYYMIVIYRDGHESILSRVVVQ